MAFLGMLTMLLVRHSHHLVMHTDSGVKQYNSSSSTLHSISHRLGAGGMVAPIVCQTIIAKGIPWTHFYLGSLVLSGINCILLFLAFRPTSRESMCEWNQANAEKEQALSSRTPSIDTEKELQRKAPLASRSHTLRLTLLMPYQWAFSIFALLYSGNETTTQGFSVTYLLGTRHANPKTVGYVTSGYWGGFAVARFIWGTFVPRLTFTQRKFIILSSFSAFASVGSALFPFISGAISDVKGISTVPYLTMSLNAVLIGIWSLFPSRLPSRATTAI
ncbi:hypothetical protein H0H92_004186 [Tricholoma furcatifolium]|nr:hypothetical protein H0H92_004186 [Tricholoma furcatifolium]